MRTMRSCSFLAILSSLALLSIIITSPHSFADDTSVVDKINITVPISCSLSGTGMDTHITELHNTEYDSAIGETTVTAFCNDKDGFAIYAIGYTDNINGKTVLTDVNLNSTNDIVTGTATSGNTSQWAMKLSTISSPVPTYPIIIAGSADDTEKQSSDPDFTSFQPVPNDYALVVKRASGTDIGTNAEGSSFKTTYQAYVSPTQAAGTYTGQVKYTLVHPNDTNKPASSMLLTGEEVNTKIKSLAAGASTNYGTQTSDIKAIRMANSLPANFTPSAANTVSTPDSKYPVYIFFDNTNNAGIMYFYTEGDTVTLNPDSRFIFLRNMALADISGLSDWDASHVTTLRTAFRETALTSLDDLEDWDTSNVTELEQTFRLIPSLNDISALANWDVSDVTSLGVIFSGDTNLSDISPLAGWDTSKVTDLSYIFENDTNLSDISALANWDTGSVTSMRGTFYNTASLSNISSLANWDTGNVTSMYALFHNDASLVDTSALSNWNTSSVTDMSFLFNKTGITSASALSSWNTGSVTNMNHMFNDTSLVDVSALSNWNTGSVTNMNHMFNDTSLVDISALSNWNTSNVEDMGFMFARDTSLRTVDISGWNTSKVTTMKSMFAVGDDYVGNGQLSEIVGLDDLDVSNVTDMTTMFYGAGQMTHYDIANWNVGKVESFNHMFCDNFKLESLDLSRWNVSSVKTIHNMFDDDSSLITVGDVSHWNTASLIDIGGWLNGATSFVGNNGTLDLSGWNTSNVKAAGEMFRATKLQTIDLSGWNFGSVINGSWSGAGEGIYYEYGNQLAAYQGFSVMFQDIPTLTNVYVSQSGLNSFNTAVGNGTKTTNMWSGSGASSFTVK